MATVTDYNTLKTAIQDWLARTDIASYTDYFIQLAENQIYRDILSQNEGRGVKQMESTLSGTISSNAVAVPSDYLALKSARISYSSDFYTLEKTTEEIIYTLHPSQSSSGIPKLIAHVGSNFVFGPYADSAYTLAGTYWSKATALSSSNTTTWMTSDIPDILLAACMGAAAEFVRDDGELQKWGNFYTKSLAGFIAQDKAAQYSGSALMIRSM